MIYFFGLQKVDRKEEWEEPNVKINKVTNKRILEWLEKRISKFFFFYLINTTDHDTDMSTNRFQRDSH
jgi:hypothetical protein